MSAGFNNDLLVVAREMRGMSQAALSHEADITQGHLSKIENGLTMPSPETISRLADALDFPQSFFLQSHRVYRPLSIHRNYRKRTTLSQKALSQLNAELSIRLMHTKKLLRAVDLAPDYRLPEFDIEDYDGDAEKIAELVRRTWRLPRGPLQNLTECMERAGILIAKCDFLGLGAIDGITMMDPECPPCVFVNREQPADRLRFTLAHELGHIVMHTIPNPTMEQEANEFASALLMPADDIRPSLSGGKLTLPRLARLKPIWKVSIQSLLVRSKTMGLVTPNQYQYLWKQISFHNLRRREPAALDFTAEEPQTVPDILQYHADTLAYTLKDFEKLLNFKEAEIRRMYEFFDSRGSHLRIIS